MGKMRKWVSYFIAAALVAGAFFVVNPLQKELHAEDGKVKNVIMMVMDGTSSTATTLARWYKGSNLALDEMVTGGFRTYSSESAITDSAPAATAFATGHKSNTGYLGVLPTLTDMPGVEQISKEDQMRPVANVLEGAKLLGKATGLVATSEIQHATPAAFSVHHYNRGNFPEIAEQQVYQNIDVVLGGGGASLLPGTGKTSRKDGENLLEVLKARGYQYVETKEELSKAEGPKIYGAFDPSSMAYDIDRPYATPEDPSLAEMTQKAIDVLSQDQDGFFLFVEGSEPDWAAHANDTVGIISEVLAFDKAVQVALDYAKQEGNTLVIAVSDHGNSGISIGNRETNGNYDVSNIAKFIGPIKKAKRSANGVLATLNKDRSNLKEALTLYGIDDLTAEEEQMLKTVPDKGLTQAVVDLLNKRAYLGYTTNGHTGEDLFLYAYGPSKPTGMIDNTEIATTMASAMGFDLEEVTNRLFVKARPAVEALGASISYDVTNKANPVLRFEKGNVKAELPVSKNIIRINGTEHLLEGVVIYSNGATYVPQQAIDLFKEAFSK